MACDIKNLLNENVSFLLRTDFPTIDKNQTLTQAFKLMEKYRIDRVVVTENK
ncbi:MAG: CBS domain-containing protein, partial [Fervidicoccus fontis]